MNCRIETIEPQGVVFVRKNGPYLKSAPEAWEALMNYDKVKNLVNQETKMIGVCHDNPAIISEDKIRYDACVSINGEIPLKGELSIQTVAGGKYAVFLHKGTYEETDDTYNYIFSKWLPESNENLRDSPIFEVYLNFEWQGTKPEDLLTEIWIPIE